MQRCRRRAHPSRGDRGHSQPLQRHASLWRRVSTAVAQAFSVAGADMGSRRDFGAGSHAQRNGVTHDAIVFIRATSDDRQAQPKDPRIRGTIRRGITDPRHNSDGLGAKSICKPPAFYADQLLVSAAQSILPAIGRIVLAALRCF